MIIIGSGVFLKIALTVIGICAAGFGGSILESWADEKLKAMERKEGK